MNPSDVNNTARATHGALKRWFNRTTVTLTAGSGPVDYTLTPTVALAAYADEIFAWITPSSNSADATLNVSALGARNIQKFTAGAWANVVADDMPSGAYIAAKYDTASSKFRIIWNSAIGLSFDITGLTALTSPSTADEVPLYDVSATANRKMELSNVLKVISGLTEDTAPAVTADVVVTYDASASGVKKVLLSTVLATVNGLTEDTDPVVGSDYVLTYDASATAAKKVKPQALTVPAVRTTASASASIDFTIETSFDYEFWLENILPATDGADLRILFSVDSGSSYLVTGTYSNNYTGITTTLNGTTTGTGAEIKVGASIDSSAAGASGVVKVVVGGAVAYGTSIHSTLRYIESTGATHVLSIASGSNSTASQVTNIRFIFSAGNITSGTIRQRKLAR